jgi:multiple sugar transport system permease protein
MVTGGVVQDDRQAPAGAGPRFGGTRPAARLGPATSRRERAHRRTGLLMVLPALLVVVVFFIAPLVFAVYISLTDWPLIGSYHFIGGQNYVAILHDPVFRQAVLFTLAFTAIVTVLVLIVGYSLAVLVRRRIRGIGLFRTLFFLPTVVGVSTLSFMALLEFQPQSGVVDFVLARLHLISDSTAWLTSPALSLIGIALLTVWSGSGLTMVVLMTGMQAIPMELYEAAEVDGAGHWSRERRIVIPLLRRSIALSLIISVISSFLVFNQFYILTEGGPGTSTTTAVLWLYVVGFTQMHLGYATAMSLVVLVLVVTVSAVQFYLLRDASD